MKPLSASDSRVQALNDSLAFRLSLSGKELFHSNVLAWALENYPAISVTLFGESLPLTSQGKADPACVRIGREEKKFDLTVEIVNPSSKQLTLIVVENKLKSIPGAQQLDDYDAASRSWTTFYKFSSSGGSYVDDEGGDKDSNETPSTSSLKPARFLYFLLAPTRPAYFQTKPNSKSYWYKNWAFLSYSDWTLALAKSVPPVSTDTYESQFISDYCHHLNSGLLPLIDRYVRADVRQTGSMLTLKSIEDATWSSKLASEPKKLRIHDLLGKCAYDEILQSLHRIFAAWPRGTGGLNLYPYYSRGQPGYGIEIILAERKHLGRTRRVSIGVQVQGYHYRRFIDKDFDGQWTKPPSNTLFLMAFERWMLRKRFPFGNSQMLGIKSTKTRAEISDWSTAETNDSDESTLVRPKAFGTQRFRYLSVEIPRACAVTCLAQETIRDVGAMLQMVYSCPMSFPSGCESFGKGVGDGVSPSSLSEKIELPDLKPASYPPDVDMNSDWFVQARRVVDS